MSKHPSRSVALAATARAAPPGFAFVPVTTRAFNSLISAATFPRLVSVTAPSGYGKTVLLSRLYEALKSRGLRCLWCSLDDRDSDLSSLLHLIELATESGPGTADCLEDAPAASFPSRGARIDTVLAQLFRSGRNTVLFIDNLGFCRDQHLATFLDHLVFAAPASLHFVLSSAESVPLDVVRAKLELAR